MYSPQAIRAARRDDSRKTPAGPCRAAHMRRMPPPPYPAPHSALLAAIDMGSNSFRLEIGQLHARPLPPHRLPEGTVRLGAGLDAERPADRRGRASAAWPACAALPRGWPASSPQVRAVATQTLREARNRNAFLLRAEAALGFPIEVISGREEARLIYAGVARLQPSTSRGWWSTSAAARPS
jgi:exopolyphosphatase/guanosine-5'-triphosphate,3'-diphosphate pyrophosphatase